MESDRPSPNREVVDALMAVRAEVVAARKPQVRGPEDLSPLNEVEP